jgi:signal transduction histidine kinase
MKELVQNLLDLAKADIGPDLRKETVNINSLLAEISDEFQPQAKVNRQMIQLQEAGDQIKVAGDALQLRQAVRNLVGNALKYSPPDSSVILSVKVEESNVTISVKDTGYGIPADDLPFIFDRFYRVRNEDVQNIEGNGLGLAIVKSIVEQHGGQVSVESRPGKGSCFTFTLPLADEK